jgi:hypothetical protein
MDILLPLNTSVQNKLPIFCDFLSQLSSPIQRIVAGVKKKDMSLRDRKEFFAEVRNIIREPGDESGKERTMPTPSPECITGKITSILENTKWQSLVPSAALKELRNLNRLHVSKGCLR